MSLQKLGRYDILKLLNKGGMALVYEAHDPHINRHVAIKTIRVDQLSEEMAAEFEARFRSEAQAAGRLQHPNIAGLYDVGRDQGVAYIVMELVRGGDLKDQLEKGTRLTFERSMAIMRELLLALSFAHEQGIIHRDIKPANVMLDANGRVKLCDFGVSRITDSGDATRTQGSMVGTLKYMSPEQIQGVTVDARTDLFAAGVVLYQMLTGVKPFEGANDFAIMQAIAQQDPPAPSTLNLSLPSGIDAVVSKALAKNRNDRYASARDFALGLRAVVQQAAAAGINLDLVTAPPTAPAPATASIQANNTGTAPASTSGGKPGGTSGSSATSASAVSQEMELLYWKDIQESSDPEDFEGFLQQFPAGVYAGLAQRRLRKLARLQSESTGSHSVASPSPDPRPRPVDPASAPTPVEPAAENEAPFESTRVAASTAAKPEPVKRETDIRRNAEEAAKRQVEDARRRAEEARQASRSRKEAEARQAEDAANADKASKEAEAQKLARLAEDARLAEEAAVAKKLRLAEEAKLVEAARVADEARAAERAKEAEKARLAQEARAAEEARRAEQARLAEAAANDESERQRAHAADAALARQADEARGIELEQLARIKKLEDERKAKEEEVRRAEDARLAAELRDAERTKKAEQERLAREAKAAQERQKAEEAEALLLAQEALRQKQARQAEDERKAKEVLAQEKLRKEQAALAAEKLAQAERERATAELKSANAAREEEAARQRLKAKEAEEAKAAERTRKEEAARLAQRAEDLRKAEDATRLALVLRGAGNQEKSSPTEPGDASAGVGPGRVEDNEATRSFPSASRTLDAPPVKPSFVGSTPAPLPPAPARSSTSIDALLREAPSAPEQPIRIPLTPQRVVPLPGNKGRLIAIGAAIAVLAGGGAWYFTRDGEKKVPTSVPTPPPVPPTTTQAAPASPAVTPPAQKPTPTTELPAPTTKPADTPAAAEPAAPAPNLPPTVKQAKALERSDLAAAARMYEQIANGTDRPALAEATKRLWEIYRDGGKGLKKNVDIAQRWYDLGRKQGLTLPTWSAEKSAVTTPMLPPTPAPGPATTAPPPPTAAPIQTAPPPPAAPVNVPAPAAPAPGTASTNIPAPAQGPAAAPRPAPAPAPSPNAAPGPATPPAAPVVAAPPVAPPQPQAPVAAKSVSEQYEEARSLESSNAIRAQRMYKELAQKGHGLSQKRLSELLKGTSEGAGWQQKAWEQQVPGVEQPKAPTRM